MYTYYAAINVMPLPKLSCIGARWGFDYDVNCPYSGADSVIKSPRKKMGNY